MQLSNEQKEKALEARRAYHRKWRSDNKDKVRTYNENFWYKKAMELLGKQEQDNE